MASIPKQEPSLYKLSPRDQHADAVTPVGKFDRERVREMIAAWMLNTRSENTRLGRLTALQKIATACGCSDEVELLGRCFERGKMWTAWLIAGFREKWIVEENKSPNTVNTYVNNFRSALKFAHDLEFRAGEGCQPITWTVTLKNLDVERVRDVKALPRNLIHERFEALPHGTTREKRDRLVVALMAGLGFRNSEVRLIETVDWDSEAQTVNIRRKGRGAKVAMPVTDSITEYFEDYLLALSKFGKPRYLFCKPTGFNRKGWGSKPLNRETIYRIARGRMKTNPHRLRRHAIQTAVDAATEAGIPLQDVIDFTGHRSVETIRHYWDRNDQRVRLIAELVESAKAADRLN